MPEQLLPLVSYCALMAATPGPNNVMLATSGANFGYRRTLPHLLGINIGLLLMTFVVCTGLGAVFERHPTIHDVLRVAGSLYLVYLAWKLAGPSVAADARAARPLTFIEGALFQAVNPKSWVRAVTIASVFMPPGMPALQGALLVSLVSAAVGFPFISVWTLFGVSIRRFLGSPRRLRAFNVAMGVSLLILALNLLMAGAAGAGEVTVAVPRTSP